MKVLDTNIFVRFLTSPESEANRRMHSACARLFEAVEAGDEEVTAPESVLHEVLYVLCSSRLYDLSHVEAAQKLSAIVAMRTFRLQRKALYLAAIDLFGANTFLDFSDAVLASIAKADGIGITSYDRDFDRLEGVVRIEP